MDFSNSYAGLDEIFYQKIPPELVRDPILLLWNSSLAEQLMIPNDLKQNTAILAEVFSGNLLLPGSEPIAVAYAGHQFGHFVPQLGDGRAHLLGEVIDALGQRRDIQLKGSGRTTFSRGGDGRCAIGPAVREFVMSEALNALRVPSTRCLAVTTTGEPVYREMASPGAIVTRVALSHLRVGTFQFFAAQGDDEALKTLCDYTINRLYPELQEESSDRYVLLLDRIIQKQIKLIVEWMRVGFIHGVMNTDNTAISGETLDYGPCAMMGIYDPQTVYSSIDVHGRYAFGNQPKIAQWNMARFAECLLTLIDPDPNKAVNKVEPLIAGFPDRFQHEYTTMMAKKLGWASFKKEDQKLLTPFLEKMKEKSMDYTITFDLLTQSLTSEDTAIQIKAELGEIFDHWKKRLNAQPDTPVQTQELMRQNNPVVIPRNHHIEAIIQECEETGDVTRTEQLIDVLRSPYEKQAQTYLYQDPPQDGDKDYQTFCGT